MLDIKYPSRHLLVHSFHFDSLNWLPHRSCAVYTHVVSKLYTIFNDNAPLSLVEAVNSNHHNIGHRRNGKLNCTPICINTESDTIACHIIKWCPHENDPLNDGEKVFWHPIAFLPIIWHHILHYGCHHVHLDVYSVLIMSRCVWFSLLPSIGRDDWWVQSAITRLGQTTVGLHDNTVLWLNLVE